MANQIKGKRSRNNSRRKTKDVKEHDKSIDVKETFNGNDPEWYIRDLTMKTGLMRMPTFEFRGTDSPIVNLVWSDTAEGVPELPINVLASPTVAYHRLNPSPGAATNQSSPINMAARMLYSKLSSSNAKTSNYAPQDVATLILAIGEIISMITHYTRLYGITQFYNKMNRAIPTGFLKAYGIRVQDVSEWTQYLPDFRAELNQLITIANSIAFPANIPYFKKCAYIYQNVYIDDASVMTGYHIMAPYSTWIIDETSYEQGSILHTRLVDSPSNIYFKTKLNTLREQIDAILTSVTYNYIYSDILNLATRNVLGSDLLAFGTIPIDYVVEPILSDQFNWQLMNATIFGAPNGTLSVNSGGHIEYTPGNDVYPDVEHNCLIYSPRWTSADGSWAGSYNIIEPIIRVPDVGVSEDDLVDLVAYTGANYIEVTKTDDTVDVTGYINDTWPDASIPDHYFVESCVLYGDTDDSRDAIIIPHNNAGFITKYASDATMANRTQAISLVSEFQHFPLVYYYSAADTSSGITIPTNLRFSSRLGAYTMRMAKAIKNIRNASFLGLFTME